MLLEGPGQVEYITSEAAVSISQLVIFNAIKRRRTVTISDTQQRQTVTPVIRHSVDRETPLPLYMGLMLHSTTRKKKLIDRCHKLGLCISYSRVMQVVNQTANAVCRNYREDDLVCPPMLQSDLFTVAATDNIDHNLSSNTAQSSFHGTAVSLMQFRPNKDTAAKCSYAITDASDSVSDIILPLSYTTIQPCVLHNKDLILPSAQFLICPDNNLTNDDYAWLDAVRLNIDSVDVSVDGVCNDLSWAAFHAQCDTRDTSCCALSTLLPLFRHTANSPAMMRHCLNVVQAAVGKLNPGQIPVITGDQPLYALMKQIQWQWPISYGEDVFVVLFGGLHTEMAALRMLGHWLDGSGWSESLVQAGVATVGVAESFLGASHVKRTRYAHTVPAAALYCTLYRGYSAYCDEHPGEPVSSFGKWRADLEETSAQFYYWGTVLELELLVLSFVRSLRLGDFPLDVDALQKLAPWFFCF